MIHKSDARSDYSQQAGKCSQWWHVDAEFGLVRPNLVKFLKRVGIRYCRRPLLPNDLEAICLYQGENERDFIVDKLTRL